MKLDDFFAGAQAQSWKIAGEEGASATRKPLSDEALFDLPFLSMAVLSFAATRRKPKVDQLGQLVSECTIRTIRGYRSSEQEIGWSTNLRIRIVNALSFLEMSQLVTVSQQSGAVSATELGRSIIRKAANSQGNLGNTLSMLTRSYYDVLDERASEVESE